MANIPTYAFPEVQQRAAPEVNMSLDVRGATGEYAAQAAGNIGQAVGSAITSIGSAALKWSEAQQHAEEQADAKQTTDAIATSQEQLQIWEHGSPEHPENGILNQRGESSLLASQGFRQKVQGQFDDIAQHYLTNDRQRQQYAMLTRTMLDQHVGIVTQHVADQVHVAQQDSVRGLQHTSLESIPTVMYGADGKVDLNAIAQEVARSEGPTKALALSAAGGQADVLMWRQHAYADVMTNLIKSGDYEGANKVFSDPDAKKALGSKAGDFQKDLTTMGQQVGSQEIAQHFAKIATDPVSKLFNQSKAQPLLDSITNPMMRKAVDDAFVAVKAQGMAQNTAIINDQWREAETAMLQGGSINSVPATNKNWLIKYAPDEWRKLMDLQEKFTKQKDAPEKETPQEVDAAITSNKSLDDRKDYWASQSEDTVRRELLQGLSLRDRKSLGMRWAGLKKTGELPTSELSTVRNAFVNELKLPPNQAKWKQSDLTDLNKIRDMVQSKRISALQDTGKEPTEEQLQDWTHKALIQNPVKGSGFTIPGTQWTLGQKQVRSIDDSTQVPDADRQQISASLKAHGKAVTDAAIADVYARAKSRQGAK